VSLHKANFSSKFAIFQIYLRDIFGHKFGKTKIICQSEKDSGSRRAGEFSKKFKTLVFKIFKLDIIK